MPLTNTLLLAFFDVGPMETIAPTANFTPPVSHPLSALTSSQLHTLTARTPDLTADQQLTWDLGAPVEFDTFALIGANPTFDVTRRFRAASDAGFTSNVVESGGALTAGIDSSLGFSRASYRPVAGRHLIYLLSDPITRQYVRWHQSDPTNLDGYQQWSIARLGLSWQPLSGFEADSYRVTPVSNGPIGAEKVLRGYEIVLHSLSRTEAYDFQSIMLSSLQSRRMFAIPEPLRPDTWPHEALWCTFVGAYVREPVAGMSYSARKYRVQITLREVDR